jgi:hypothetical protein
MINMYLEKYKDASEFLVLKSIAYFNDADLSNEPYMYMNMKWRNVKSTIIKKLNQYLESKSDQI